MCDRSFDGSARAPDARQLRLAARPTGWLPDRRRRAARLAGPRGSRATVSGATSPRIMFAVMSAARLFGRAGPLASSSLRRHRSGAESPRQRALFGLFSAVVGVCVFDKLSAAVLLCVKTNTRAPLSLVDTFCGAR